MAKGYKSGVSSLPAGLKIVGNPRPSFPKEGTVWVNTDVEPTGYYLSATHPENMAQGNIWVKILDSTQNKICTPISKDSITIMLDSVRQYVNGELVDVEAMTFQNGVWIEIDNKFYLIKNGIEVAGYGFNSKWRTHGGYYMTPSDDCIQYTSTEGYNNAYVTTEKVTELPQYTSIVADVEIFNAGLGVGLVVLSGYGVTDYNASLNLVVSEVSSTKLGRQTIRLNISNVKEPYYVGSKIEGGNAIKYNLYDLWLE